MRPAAFAFASTTEVEPLDGAIGQPRALRALEFALGVETGGYNVYAAGPVGTGKRTTIARHLADYASRRETPGDWVYLFDFEDEQRPRAVRLPPSRGSALARRHGRAGQGGEGRESRERSRATTTARDAASWRRNSRASATKGCSGCGRGRRS